MVLLYVLLWIIRVQSQLTLLTRLKGYDKPLPFQQEALFVPNNKILSISCGRRQGLLSAEMKRTGGECCSSLPNHSSLNDSTPSPSSQDVFVHFLYVL